MINKNINEIKTFLLKIVKICNINYLMTLFHNIFFIKIKWNQIMF